MSITPGRRTVVTIDTADVFTQEKTIFIEKRMEDIAPIDLHRRFASTPTGTFPDFGYNVTVEPNQGWTLASQMEAGEYGYETDQFDAGIPSLTLHPTIFGAPRYVAATDLPGVTLGATQQASGFGAYQRAIAAGGSFDTELTADRAAYPPPTMDEIQPLKRLAVGTVNLEPTAKISYSYLFLDNTPFGTPGPISRVYFTSLAGTAEADGEAVGTGQYSLTFLGTGRAILKERLVLDGEYSWVDRAYFPWLSQTGVQRGFHTVRIYSDAVKLANGSYRGTKIMFSFLDFQGASFQENVRQAAESSLQKPFTYLVPGANLHQPILEKLRIDDRRDVRSIWRVQNAHYYRTGTIRTRTVDVKFQTSSTEPIYVGWFGRQPAGTTLSIRCFDFETGLELTPLGASFDGLAYGVKGFDATSGRQPDTSTRKYTRTKFYAVITATSADGTVTPLVQGVRWFRNPIRSASVPEPIQLKNVDMVSISGQDSDPTHETLLVKCRDLFGELGRLQLRAGMPIRVDVQYDPEDDTKVSNIFSGYVAKATRKIKGAKRGKEYPVDNWAEYELRCTGEWQRLMEAKTSQAYSFARDAQASHTDQDLTWKITDIIRTLINDAYPDENILIPDLEPRIDLSGAASELAVLEPISDIFPVCQTLVFSYLGGWLNWDGNASGVEEPTKMGAWRLFLPPKPDEDGQFRWLAHFKHSPNVLTTEFRLRYVDKYQLTETGLGGQPIKTIWVRKGSPSSHVVPPEANAVRVTGSGTSDAAFFKSLANGESNSLDAMAHNYVAAKFFDGQPIEPDPNHPDYTSGRPVWIYVGDPSFHSQRAVNFTCRRIFDVACHAQKRISAEAALLLVTDINDPYQRQPRPLRYGDPVKYMGASFFVGSCSTDYSSLTGGSRKMMALYEFFSPTNIGEWNTAGTFYI